MSKLNPMARRGILVLIAFTLFLQFQNCSEVDFVTQDELLSQNIWGDLRSVEIGPGYEDPPEIQVHVIVDNSASMEIIQSHVQKALASTANILSGFDGKVKIYTTSQESALMTKSNLVKVLDNTGNWILVPPANLSSYLTANQPYTYYKIENYLLNPIFTELNFNNEMSTAQFDQFANQFSSQITQVGVAGSNTEQGLCSLLRISNQNQKDGKFHAYIIATNENDQTTISGCLNQKETRVDNSLQTVSSSATCIPGDADCNNTYNISYLPSQKENLSFSYRTVSEKLSYKSLIPVITYRGVLSYKKTTLKAKYKRFQKTLTTSYVKTDVRDGVPYPGASATVTSTTVGLCDPKDFTDGVRLCTDAERGSLFAHYASPCTVKCTDYYSTPAVAVTGFSDLSTGYTLNGEKAVQDFSQSSLDCKSYLKDQKAIPYVSECAYFVQIETPSSGYFNLTNKPRACSELGGNYTCSQTELDQLQILAGSVYANVPDNLLTCTRSCTETSAPVGTQNLSTTKTICDGLSADQNGSVSVACSISEEQSARNLLGLTSADPISCSRVCSHSIQNKTYAISNTSSCSVNTMACNPSQWDAAVSQSSGTLLSCNYNCTNNTAPANCSFVSKEANLCSLSAQQIYTNGQCANKEAALNPLNMSSCRIASSSKSTFNNFYSEKEQAPVSSSFISANVDDVIENTTADSLKNAHGDLFYLASFNYPTDTTLNCNPPFAGLSRGQRYENVAKILSVNADTFPLCLDDYAPSFSSIFNLITEKVLRSYKLNLDEANGEWVYRVKITDARGVVSEVPKILYSVTGGTITFNEIIDIQNAQKMTIEIVVPRKTPPPSATQQ